MGGRHVPTPLLAALLLAGLAGGVGGQDDAPPAPQDCGCGGSVALAVVVAVVVTLVVVAVVFFCCRRGSTPAGRKTDAEVGGAAYDNPHFQYDDGTTEAHRGASGGGGEGLSDKSMTTLEKLVHAVRTSGGRNASPKRTRDDSQLAEASVVAVPLRGRDFTGLGFNIYGNMRDGVFVKDVLHRGPASEGGAIAPGDRVLGLAVSTEHMVHEDALTILSYASPYPVLLLLEKAAPGTAARRPPAASAGRPVHPFYRSQSIDDLAKIGKADMSRVRAARVSGASPPGVDVSRPDLVGGLSLGPPRPTAAPRTTAAVQREAPERHSERAIDVPGAAPPHAHAAREGADLAADKSESRLKFGIKVLPDLTGRGGGGGVDLEAGGGGSVAAEAEALRVAAPQLSIEKEGTSAAEGLEVEAKRPPGAKFGIKLPQVRAGGNLNLQAGGGGGGGGGGKFSHEPKTDDEKQEAKGSLGAQPGPGGTRAGAGL
ncbi:hypothetical protein O3P69_018806 [Scylla paramamosain]|uniref:PDZ domain-containing protein n=1 Tax=Scylla paramamosain TaxID=85552 RepID=A0AAW0SSH0_SCYPA